MARRGKGRPDRRMILILWLLWGSARCAGDSERLRRVEQRRPQPVDPPGRSPPLHHSLLTPNDAERGEPQRNPLAKYRLASAKVLEQLFASDYSRPMLANGCEAISGADISGIPSSPQDGQLLNQVLDTGIGRYLQAKRDGDSSLDTLSIPVIAAQALAGLAVRSLRQEPGNRSRSDRHHISLVIHLDPDGTFHPETPLPVEGLCDASFTLIVLGAQSEILDIGHTTRTWPGPMAGAIRWWHTHHCIQWENGGHTSINNGILLCRWHRSTPNDGKCGSTNTSNPSSPNQTARCMKPHHTSRCLLGQLNPSALQSASRCSWVRVRLRPWLKPSPTK